MMICSLLAALPACATNDRIVYTGPVSADQTTQGFPRLVDNKVEVSVQGTTAVGELPDVRGWFLVHPEHLKRFLKNTERLQKVEDHKLGKLVLDDIDGKIELKVEPPVVAPKFNGGA